MQLLSREVKKGGKNMFFDLTIPIVIFIFSVTISYVYPSFEKRVEKLFAGERELSCKEIALVLLIISINLVVMFFLPENFLPYLILFATCVFLFSAFYILTNKEAISVALVIFFLASYFFLKGNIITFNMFSFIIAFSASLIFNTLFTWRTVWLFLTVLTSLDVFFVFCTNIMVTVAERALELSLPLLIKLPSFPLFLNRTIGLGLGDLLVASLIAVQTAKEINKKAGLMSSIGMSLSTVVMGIVLLNFKSALPATVFLYSGGALVAVIYYLKGKMEEGRV